MNKQTRILFNFKKETNADTCYNMGEHELTDRPQMQKSKGCPALTWVKHL